MVQKKSQRRISQKLNLEFFNGCSCPQVGTSTSSSFSNVAGRLGVFGLSWNTIMGEDQKRRIPSARRWKLTSLIRMDVYE